MMMNIRTLAISAIALSLLAPAAFAGNSFGNPNLPAGSEVTNQQIDYSVDTSNIDTTNAFAAAAISEGQSTLNSGEYIDETNVERNQRSSR
jgi:hypothetical protein